MTIITEKILKEAKMLPPMERAALLEGIINSFDSAPDPELEKLWIAEAQKRLSKYKKGQTRIISEQEFMKKFNKHK